MKKKRLPKHISDAIEQNRTSLGKHPALPPESDTNPLMSMVELTYNEAVAGVGEHNLSECQKKIKRTVDAIQKAETPHRGELEKLACQTAAKIVGLPSDAVEIIATLQSGQEKASLQTSINDADKPQYEYENLSDMRNLTDEVYKRRMLDVLVRGAATKMGADMTQNLRVIYDMDYRLTALYADFVRMERYTRYEAAANDDSEVLGGTVDVYIGDGKPRIKAQGIVFPILVTEIIKGLLEIVIAHGLPTNRAKAVHVMTRADLPQLEVWDMRIGEAIIDHLANLRQSPVDGEMMAYMLMDLCQMNPNTFNKTIAEILAGTRAGKNYISNIGDDFCKESESEELEQWLQSKRETILNERGDGYYTADELVDEPEAAPFKTR